MPAAIRARTTTVCLGVHFRTAFAFQALRAAEPLSPGPHVPLLKENGWRDADLPCSVDTGFELMDPAHGFVHRLGGGLRHSIQKSRRTRTGRWASAAKPSSNSAPKLFGSMNADSIHDHVDFVLPNLRLKPFAPASTGSQLTTVSADHAQPLPHRRRGLLDIFRWFLRIGCSNLCLQNVEQDRKL